MEWWTEIQGSTLSLQAGETYAAVELCCIKSRILDLSAHVMRLCTSASRTLSQGFEHSEVPRRASLRDVDGHFFCD
jgi:hypothetical protein